MEFILAAVRGNVCIHSFPQGGKSGGEIMGSITLNTHMTALACTDRHARRLCVLCIDYGSKDEGEGDRQHLKEPELT